MLQADIDYFHRGDKDNPRYWSRFGYKPDLSNSYVAEVGCGHGSLTLDIAKSGVKRVIGFDLDARRIEFAQQNLEQNYPRSLRTVVEFRRQDIRDAPEAGFDLFVSKDSFEHFIDLAETIEAMRKKLRPGGRIYLGSGGLWNSPFGDHGALNAKLPWSHVLFGERYVMRQLKKRNMTSVHDLGLSGLSLAEYRRIFKESGMNMVYLRTNVCQRLTSKIMTVISKLPFLEEYFTHNLYCILEKGV